MTTLRTYQILGTKITITVRPAERIPHKNDTRAIGRAYKAVRAQTESALARISRGWQSGRLHQIVDLVLTARWFESITTHQIFTREFWEAQVND